MWSGNKTTLHVCKHLKMAKCAIEACDSDEMDINDNPQSPEVETSLGCSKRRKVAYSGAAKYPSNAVEERLFSMVRKNKTDSKSSLRLDGTLSNLYLQ